MRFAGDVIVVTGGAGFMLWHRPHKNRAGVRLEIELRFRHGPREDSEMVCRKPGLVAKNY
jgi:hypothetical protein